MSKPLSSHIEHVVVLMFENRSFDNVLGGLYPSESRGGAFRGLIGNETNPRDPANPGAGSVSVFQGGATQSTFIAPYPDPGELYSDMVEQIFGSTSSVLPTGTKPPMSGFAWNYTQQPPSPSGRGFPGVRPRAVDIMQYYSGRTMPTSTAMAKHYAVCDSWFAAAPVQTLANRTMAHCGTPGKVPGTNSSRVNNPTFTNNLTVPFVPPVTDTTIFELLDTTYPGGRAPGCSLLPPRTFPLNWKIYYHDVPLSALCKYVYDHWCFDQPFGGNVFSFKEHLSRETNFEFDIKNGLLPKYSFIEPRYTDFFGGTVNSNHPGGAGVDLRDPNAASLPPPVSVADGEQLLWDIHAILVKYPEVFSKTLLIVTYDEHGGLFDHVPPPAATSPFNPPVDNFDYDRYGVRVPAILINPSIAPGTIYPARSPGAPLPEPPFDHTSILSTLIAQFELEGSLSPRVEVAPKLENLIKPMTHSPLSIPRPAASPEQPPKSPPPIVDIPRQAPNLGGALGALYQVVQGSNRASEPGEESDGPPEPEP